jgi:hypothetical protein
MSLARVGNKLLSLYFLKSFVLASKNQKSSASIAATKAKINICQTLIIPRVVVIKVKPSTIGSPANSKNINDKKKKASELTVSDSRIATNWLSMTIVS